jgi:lysophospholipase L1-like esterase
VAERRFAGRLVTAAALAAAALIMVAACGTQPHTEPSTAPTTATPSAAPPATPSSSPSLTPSPSRSPTAGPLQMFGLGDSVPAADNCGCRGFLEQSADLLAPMINRPVRLRNDAVDGWTTSSVVSSLRSGQARKDLAGGAGLVIIEAGANDLALDRITDPSCQPVESSSCFRPQLTAVGDALTTAVEMIRTIDPDHDPTIALMGYWNVSVDGRTGQARGSEYLKDSDDLTLALNQVVRTVVARTHTIYVDAYTPLKGPEGSRDPSPYLLSDGDHPNKAGYRLLAEAVVDKLQQAGAVAAWSAGH